MQEINPEKIKVDENGQMRFDFSAAEDLFEPHDLASQYSDYLSDVDFVIEDTQEIICMEYKNSAVKNAGNPEEMVKKIEDSLDDTKIILKKPSFVQRLAKKYYGTLWIMWACGKNLSNKPIRYVFLLESNPVIDSVIKKRLEAKMMSQLPFKYENNENIKRHVIQSFKVVDLEQWREMYPKYPVSYIE